MRRLRRFAGLCALIFAIAVAPARAADSTALPAHPVVVLAAASLTDAFNAIGAEFEKAHPGVAVRFSFAG